MLADRRGVPAEGFVVTRLAALSEETQKKFVPTYYVTRLWACIRCCHQTRDTDDSHGPSFLSWWSEPFSPLLVPPAEPCSLRRGGSEHSSRSAVSRDDTTRSRKASPDTSATCENKVSEMC